MDGSDCPICSTCACAAYLLLFQAGPRNISLGVMSVLCGEDKIHVLWCVTKIRPGRLWAEDECGIAPDPYKANREGRGGSDPEYKGEVSA